jgi:hypothetical protein
MKSASSKNTQKFMPKKYDEKLNHLIEKAGNPPST